MNHIFKPILNLLQVLTTIDYLEDNDKGQFTEQYFQELREYQPRGPLVNSEYYTGWLDKWGSPHKTRCKLMFNISWGGGGGGGGGQPHFTSFGQPKKAKLG